MSLTSLPHLVEAGDPAAPVILALHGTGGSEHDGIAIARALAPAAGVIAPRGRVSEQGMNRWFRRLAEGVFDVDDVEARADELAGFVTEAVAEYGFGDRMLVAVGFSNGANIALATAMRHPEVLPRVIAFSGMYPFGDRTPADSLAGLDVLVLNGHDDPMAPRASVERLTSTLDTLGATATRTERPGGHGISADDLEHAQQWLAARVA